MNEFIKTYKVISKDRYDFYKWMLFGLIFGIFFWTKLFAFLNTIFS